MDGENDKLLRKGQAARFFGYAVTAGYRYLYYLVEEKIIEPRFLPGVKTPRFYLSDLKRVAEASKQVRTSKPFVPVPKG